MKDKYLDKYIKVLPESQAKKLNELTQYLLSNSTINKSLNEEQLVDLINRLSIVRERITQFKSVNPDMDLVSSLDFNTFYMSVYIDLIWLYYECYLLEQSIGSKSYLMESDIAYIKSEINNLRVKIDSLNLAAEETSYTQMYIENFNESNIFHIDSEHDSLYVDRDNTPIPKCSFQDYNYDRSLVLSSETIYDICDVVPEGLQPPSARVLDYVGLPKTKAGYEIEKVIDNSVDTFWGEFILSDEIINRKMIFPPPLKDMHIVTIDNVAEEVLNNSDNFKGKINAMIYSLDDPVLPEELAVYGYDMSSASNNIFMSTDFGSIWTKQNISNITYNDISSPVGINSPVIGFSSDSGNILCNINRTYNNTNQFFTYSIYVQTTDDLTVQCMIKTSNSFIYSDSVEVIADTEWHRIAFVLPVHEEQLMVGFRFVSTAEGQRIWICAPQMESGNILTSFNSRQYTDLKYPISAVISNAEADKNFIHSYDYGSWYKAAFTYNPTNNSANNDLLILTRQPVITNYKSDESYVLSLNCIIPKEYEKTIENDYTGKVVIHTITENDIDFGFYSDKKLNSSIKEIKRVAGNIYKYTIELKDPFDYDEVYLGISINKTLAKDHATFFYINKASMLLEKNNNFSEYITVINGGGAMCAICITLPQIMRINRINILPFSQYPVSIESILAYKTPTPETELERPVVVFSNNNTNFDMTPFEYGFDKTEARSIVIFIRQPSYTENTYTIRDSVNKDIELWNLIVNEEFDASIAALINGSNETVSQERIDEITGMEEYLNNYEDYVRSALQYLDDLNSYITDYGMYGAEWRPPINLPEWVLNLPEVQDAAAVVEASNALAIKAQEDRELDHQNKMEKFEADYKKYLKDKNDRENLIKKARKKGSRIVYH